MDIWCSSYDPSVRPTVRPIIRPTIRATIRLSVGPFVRSTVRPFVRPFVRPSVRSADRLCIRPSVCPSVLATVRPSVRSTVRPSVRPFIRATVRSSVRLCPSVCPSPIVRPTVRPTVRPSVRSFVCASARPSVRLWRNPGKQSGLRAAESSNVVNNGITRLLSLHIAEALASGDGWDDSEDIDGIMYCTNSLCRPCGRLVHGPLSCLTRQAVADVYKTAVGRVKQQLNYTRTNEQIPPSIAPPPGTVTTIQAAS